MISINMEIILFIISIRVFLLGQDPILYSRLKQELELKIKLSYLQGKP